MGAWAVGGGSPFALARGKVSALLVLMRKTGPAAVRLVPGLQEVHDPL